MKELATFGRLIVTLACLVILGVSVLLIWTGRLFNWLDLALLDMSEAVAQIGVRTNSKFGLPKSKSV